MARGSIVERNGSLSLVIDLGKDGNGKRRQKWVTFHGSKSKAKVKLTELLHAADNGTLAEPRGTVGEFLTRWLREYVESNMAKTTQFGYEYIIRSHIVPVIGNLALKSLKPEVLQRYYADRLKYGLSSTSVRHHHVLLHRAMKHAVQWGLLARNPCDSVSPPRIRKSEMHVLNEDGIATILKASENSPYFTLFYLALGTGLRRSEILGLRWSDVDLVGAELSVSRSVIDLRNGKFQVKDTKTGKHRQVALSPSTCQVLRQYLDSQMEIKARLGIPFSNDSLVFSHIDGTPLKGNSVGNAWRKLVKRLGLSGVRFHDLRHTMATMMLKQGVHPRIVQERLGHSSIAITLDVYSHVTPGLQQSAAQRLDEFLINSVSKPLANNLKIDKVEAKI